MRAPLSWLSELVDVPAGATGRDVAASFVSVGLEEEDLHGGDITGPLVVGRVLSFTDEPQKNGKVIRWCTVDVGPHGQMASEGKHQEIVCGAHNFEVGDLVVVVLPGAVLPGGFAIAARKTYGHVSNGMICAEDELGLGEDHSGIIVLQRYLGEEAAAALQPGDDAIALLGLADEVVEVNVTPDRGYCFSLRGLAREYWHSQGSPAGAFRDPADVDVPAATPDGYPVVLADDAPIDGRAGCDRFVARVVRGVDPQAPTPAWMAKRLTQMGMRPISLAVDVTNYVMLLTGQPLHAYDLGALSGSVQVRRARPGERLTTLDGVERTLHEQDLLVTDGGQTPLGLAGVMGGASSEISDATRDVLVEAAHFDPMTVARTARRHKLVSEASKRFERGVDPQLPPVAAQLVVDLLVAHGGGTAGAEVTDVDATSAAAPYGLDLALPGRLVGVDYPAARVVGILRDLGCTVQEPGEQGDGTVDVTPPSWRPDLVDGPDYAEEVARVDGYEKIPSVVPAPTNGRGLTHGQRVRRVVATALVGRGLTEVLTYPFVSERLADQLGLPEGDDRRFATRVANPLSDEAPLMRTTVIGSLVDALRRNVSRGRRDVGLFELGLVTRPGADGPRPAPVPGVDARPDDATVAAIEAAVPRQPRHVGILAAGDADRAGWWGPGRPVDWSDVVDAARAVAHALAVELVVEADREHAPWHPGRCARLSLPDGTLVGHAGELHPKVCAALDLPARTCAAELDVDVLTRASEPTTQLVPFSDYPVALTDVALVVDATVPAAQVERALRAGAGDALESVELFDVYAGEQVGEGRTSLAYRMAFRAPDRTLTTEEVNGFRDAAVASAATLTGAVQR